MQLDPFRRWIESNLDYLLQYEGEFIAIHPEKGVVFHHKEDEVFGKWLESLPQEEADQLLPTHADKYL